MQMRTIRDEISSWVSKKRVEGRLKVLRRWCKTFWLEWSKTVIFVVYGLLVYDSQVIEQQHDSSSDAQLMMICCCVDNIDLRRKNVFFTAWLIRSVDCDTKLASSTCFSLKMCLPHRLLKGTFTETSAQTSKGTKRQDSFLKVLDFLYCLYCLYAESLRYKNDELRPHNTLTWNRLPNQVCKIREEDILSKRKIGQKRCFFSAWVDILVLVSSGLFEFEDLFLLW